MKTSKTLIAALCIVAITACTGPQGKTKGTLLGAGTGAAIGGLATNSWGGAAVGAVAGGVVGNVASKNTKK
jgi:hypothetical protein